MTENWSKQSIVDAYNSGRRDFSREYFGGLDLREITLSEADLSEADLSEADLSEAKLSGANMAWTNLSGADMSGADLRRAELAWANLVNADLAGADLRWANLTEADLTGADLTEANMTGADLDYASWPLWCGSLGVKVDKKIAVQLAYHLCALDCDDPEYQEARAKVLGFANQMHRTDVKRLE